MKISRSSALIVSGLLTVFAANNASAQSGSAFNIDFVNADWTHNVSGGGTVTQKGWAKSANVANRYTSGSTTFKNGTVLSVSTRFFGTAKAGADNFSTDAVNTNGFSFQNAGTGDTNGVDSSGRTILLNYQRIDFSFSNKVSMDFLRISDIDTTTSSGTQPWRDAVAVGLWNVAPSVSPPATPGSLTDPTIALSNPTRLVKAQTSSGLDYVYAQTTGNTTAPNPAPANDPSSATFEYDNQYIQGFSIYFWNRGNGNGTDTKHAVVLQAGGNSFIPIPEPSTSGLVGIGVLALAFRRKRK